MWRTHGKTFETWMCSLVHALIGYCDDTILRFLHLPTRNAFAGLLVFGHLLLIYEVNANNLLFLSRLCQDIVLQKAEVAELLFPDVVVNLSSRKNVDIDLCEVISLKVLFHD